MEEKITAEEAAAIAVKKTKEMQEAVETSRAMQTEVSDARLAKAIGNALRDVFGEHENSGRFIDTNRIPMICQDLKGIHSSVDKIEGNLSKGVWIVLTAVILAVLALIIKQ